MAGSSGRWRGPAVPLKGRDGFSNSRWLRRSVKSIEIQKNTECLIQVNAVATINCNTHRTEKTRSVLTVSSRSPVMAIVCWTVLHHRGSAVRHGVSRLAHAGGHHAHPIVRHVGNASRHASKLAAHPNTWAEVVCKAIPAALAGGGILIPHPADLPRIPDAPPARTALGPTLLPGFPPDVIVGPGLSAKSGAGVTRPTDPPLTPPESAPEPSSAGILLGGVAGLLFLRMRLQRLAYSTHIQPASNLAKLPRIGPVS